MELDKVRKYLYNEVKLDFIRGKVDGVAKLPTDSDINSQINNIISSSNNGIIGSIVTFVYKNTSSVNDYNNNFLTIKDNIEYLLEDVYDSLNEIIDVVNNSVLEKNQILRELKKMDQEFSDIESGSLHSDGLKYVISDSFNDTEKIDTLRTTAQLNLNAGNVTLNTARASYLGFPHYRNQTSVNFTFTEGYANIVSQHQTPGTKFGDIFTGTDTNRWELVATTNSAVEIAGYLSLKLSEIGSAVSINSITMKLFGTKDVSSSSDLLTFEYMNNDPSNSVWMIIPNGQISITGPEITLAFPAIVTTYIRITWTKYYPDDMKNLEYHFSITEMNVGTSLTVYESDLISTSLELQSYQNEQPTIYVAEVETDNYTQAGTSIQFYLATDDTIPGKVIDKTGNVVDIDSDDAYAFVPNGVDKNGKAETYYTFASFLRDNSNLSGAFPYAYWQPNWQQVAPLTAHIPGVPNQVFFNVSQYNNNNNNLYFTEPVLFGDPSYKGPWPVSGYGITWAQDWTGSGLQPTSGYIWGEDPTTTAGQVWGNYTSFPGWWRPLTPTSSGTYLSTPTISIPDFIVPVLDSNGNALSYFNPNTLRKEPIQKQFWKIFKWPSNALPIPSTIKLSSNVLQLSNQINNNSNAWTWNYSSSSAVADYQLAFTLDPSSNFFTLRLEEYLPTTSNISIVQNSFRNIQFSNITPADITDYTVGYGYEYIRGDDGLVHKIQSDPSLQYAHATIAFSDSIINQARLNSSGLINLSMLLSYQSTTNISASWDGYLLVPTSVGSNLPECYINDMTNINQVTVQQVSDAGMILQTNTMASGSFSSFSLYTGLNLVRIFVNTLMTQSNVTDKSIAGWRPDDYQIKNIPGVLISDTNNPVLYSAPNSITEDYNNKNINFVSNSIIPGVSVICTNPMVMNSEGKLVYTTSQVAMTVIQVALNNLILQSPDNNNYYITNWSINNFTAVTGFTYDTNVTPANGKDYLTEVDINVLLHETEIDDDSRFAMLDDVDGSKYVVVKTPHSFSSSIVNDLHYNRTYWDYIQGQSVTYTTGTSGNIGMNPITIKSTSEPIPKPLVNMPPNTFSGVLYPNVSTFGLNINVTDATSSGFLFWDTAENLSSVFTISYSVPANNYPADRIFVMAKLLSSDLTLTPTLNSYNIIINNEIEGA